MIVLDVVKKKKKHCTLILMCGNNLTVPCQDQGQDFNGLLAAKGTLSLPVTSLWPACESRGHSRVLSDMYWDNPAIFPDNVSGRLVRDQYVLNYFS